ncbi:MAG: DUF2637 domain-containing protein [Chloroflexi bacterium]|nr:DUF2637 domain-containing protein [Chloroflexota bacterium]MBP8058888.1 DUF2637 domain-containing protein [Chloroflexota bacterium]
MNRTNTLISTLTGVLVFLLAAAAFLLSFDALKHLAATNGIPAGKSWIYPAIVDGAIIVFSLSVLQASLNRQHTLYPWILVGAFTVLSVILNIVHAPATFLSRVLAAIPPLALFLSFELLMGQIKGIVQRSGAVQSLQELLATIQNKRAELDGMIRKRQAELDVMGQQHLADVQRLTAQVEQLTTKKDALVAELHDLRQQRSLLQTPKSPNSDSIERARAAKEVNKRNLMNALLVYLADHPDASLSEMATAIERSKATASNYVNELQTNGQLHKNGHGWEVLSR